MEQNLPPTSRILQSNVPSSANNCMALRRERRWATAILIQVTVN